jgi:hypothetical protein
MDTVTDNSLAIYQGADFVYPFTVRADGVAEDITGATFTAMFRWNYADASPVFDLDSSDITIVVAASGTAKIAITDTATAAVVVPTSGIQNIIGGGFDLYYDVNMLLGGLEYRVLRGVAKFYQSALQ